MYLLSFIKQFQKLGYSPFFVLKQFKKFVLKKCINEEDLLSKNEEEFLLKEFNKLMSKEVVDVNYFNKCVLFLYKKDYLEEKNVVFLIEK